MKGTEFQVGGGYFLYSLNILPQSFLARTVFKKSDGILISVPLQVGCFLVFGFLQEFLFIFDFLYLIMICQGIVGFLFVSVFCFCFSEFLGSVIWFLTLI